MIFVTNIALIVTLSRRFFEDIEKVQIKNFPRKYPSENLKQIIVFVYMNVMKFPSPQYFIPNIVTKAFFKKNINNIMEGKVNLHHSHTTGQIMGYSHSFCNLKVREDI